MSINTPAPADPAPTDLPYPAASPAAARARVRRLHRAGNTYQAIAIAAGLAPATVRDLAHGRRHPVRGTTAAVLTMKPETMPRTRLDAGGTRLRLRALHVMGHGCVRIARAAGAHPGTIRKIVRGDARTVSPQLRTAVIAVYEAWWDKRAPTRTRFERGTAT